MGNEKVYVHHQGRYFSKFFLFIGFALMAVPVVLTIAMDLNWPLVFTFFGAFFFLPGQQFEVDFAKKRCRDCTNILGYKIGDWEDISGARALITSKKRYTINMPSGLMGMGSKVDELFVLALHFQMQNGKKLEIDEFDQVAKGVKVATDIANGLHIPISDVANVINKH